MHVELSGSRNVTDPGDGSTHDDELIDQIDHARITLKSPCNPCKRTEAQDRYIARIRLEPVNNQFITAHDMLPLYRLQAHISQTVGTMKIAGIAHRSVLGIGADADSRVTWWI